MDHHHHFNHKTINVLMFPWLAHGHISPYLELAKRLTTRNFIVHLCSTPANLSSIKHNIPAKFSRSIVLVELHLATDLLPSHYHTTYGLPPDLMPKLKLSLDASRSTFSDILASFKPDLLVYDFLQPWAPLVASLHHIPAVEFITSSSTMTAYMFNHLMKKPISDFPNHNAIEYRDHELAHRANMVVLDEKTQKNAFLGIRRSSKIVLVKGFREIEGEYVDYLSGLLGKKFVPVGPLVQNPSHDIRSKEIMDWLDDKAKGSTVYVSFGSEYFLKENDMIELAHGLELSNLNFIWVVRFPKGEKKTLEESLPLGFLGRVGGRGLVIEGWAPQAEILVHDSVGGFVSHCGCSSMMESMKFGVPIIAMPMHLDQPLNARLVGKIGVGVEVERSGVGRLEREEVAAVIRRVVVEESGGCVREKARLMSEKIKDKGDEEVDDVVMEFVKLCNRNNRKRNGFRY